MWVFCALLFSIFTGAVDIIFNLDLVMCDLYPRQDVEFQITEQIGAVSNSRLVVHSCTMRVCGNHACQSSYRTRFVETGFSACSNVIVSTRLPHNGGVCSTYGTNANHCQRNYYCVPAQSFPPTPLPASLQSTTAAQITSSTAPTVQARYWRIASLDYSRPFSIIELEFDRETPSGGVCSPTDIYGSCSKVLDKNLMSKSRWTSTTLGSEYNPNFWAYDFRSDRIVTSFKLIQYPETNEAKLFLNELSLQYSVDGDLWTEYLRTCVSVGDEAWRFCNTSIPCGEVDIEIGDKVVEEEEIEWNIKKGGWITIGVFSFTLCCFSFLLNKSFFGNAPGAEGREFQWTQWFILAAVMIGEIGAMFWSLVEQRACPMSFLLIIGLELQFCNLVLVLYFLPSFHESGSGMDSGAQKNVMCAIATCDLVTLILICIPAFACPDMNLEDALAAVFGFLSLIVSTCHAIDEPKIWTDEKQTNKP